MHIQQNISLKNYNTFGIEASAEYFAAFASLEDLENILEINNQRFGATAPALILGGGSNILLTKNVAGLVAKNEIQGIETVEATADYFYVKAGAGVGWHSLVMHGIAHGMAGMENLSLIPGCVGASPMQNIGAYGVEIKDIFYQLQAYDLEDRKVVSFGLEDCGFGYRESVFKRKYKDRFIILDVTYKLDKVPTFHTSYGAIEKELETMGVQDLSIRAISDAVINIRSSKLPDPKTIGNAGSFFKNPEIDDDRFIGLKNGFPNIVGYDLPNGHVKLAAGWLIEQCGWKGYRDGDAGVHDKQALVLVNHGHASGAEILGLSSKVIASVQEKFGVGLEREVNIF